MRSSPQLADLARYIILSLLRQTLSNARVFLFGEDIKGFYQAPFIHFPITYSEMRHSVGQVAKPPFLSFITPLRSRSFSPACSRANDLVARPLRHFRYEYHSRVPSSFQTLLPVTIFGKEKNESPRTPGKTSLKVVIRKSSSTSGGVNAQNAPRSELPSHEEGRRSQISKSFTRIMDHLQSNIFIAGQRLNDLTGYSGIEALKRDIELQGQ